jgi:hypothetical protein
MGTKIVHTFILILAFTLTTILIIDIHSIPFHWMNIKHVDPNCEEITLNDTILNLEMNTQWEPDNANWIKKIKYEGFHLILTEKANYFISLNDNNVCLRQVFLPRMEFIDQIVIKDPIRDENGHFPGNQVFIFSIQEKVEPSYSNPGLYAISGYKVDSIGFHPIIENENTTVYYRVQNGVKLSSQPFQILEDGKRLVTSDQYVGYYRANEANLFTFHEYIWDRKKSLYRIENEFVKLSTRVSKSFFLIPLFILLIIMFWWRIKLNRNEKNRNINT